MSKGQRIAAAVCVALHVFVLWNVWHAYQLTPRIINIEACSQ